MQGTLESCEELKLRSRTPDLPDRESRDLKKGTFPVKQQGPSAQALDPFGPRFTF